MQASPLLSGAAPGAEGGHSHSSELFGQADYDSGLLVINDSRFSVLRLCEKLDLYAAQVVI